MLNGCFTYNSASVTYMCDTPTPLLSCVTSFVNVPSDRGLWKAWKTKLQLFISPLHVQWDLKSNHSKSKNIWNLFFKDCISIVLGFKESSYRWSWTYEIWTIQNQNIFVWISNGLSKWRSFVQISNGPLPDFRYHLISGLFENQPLNGFQIHT